MPSPDFDATVAMLAAAAPAPGTPVEQRRAAIDGLSMLLPVAPGVTIDPIDAGGVPAAWFLPQDVDLPSGSAPLLWLHGGGYNIGSVSSHQAAASHLAAAANRPVLLASYRLAPEHPFPAALDDARAVWDWLVASGHTPERIGVVGDSAGGGLALALTMGLRDAGLGLPGALALLCPWTDLSGEAPPAPDRIERDVVLQVALLDEWASAYAGPTSRRHPLVSPRFGDLSGLPSMLIHTAGRDLIGPDGERLASEARAAGVTVDHVDEPDLIHDWHMFAGAFPEASDTLGDVAAWLTTALGD